MIGGKTNYVRTTAATIGLTDQVKSSLSSTYRKNGSPLRSLSSDRERQRNTNLTVSGLLTFAIGAGATLAWTVAKDCYLGEARSIRIRRIGNANHCYHACTGKKL